MSRPSTRPRRPGEPAFTLIEILIAIIILALGLLGLGAVFPVVIREQKVAQDRIAGAVADNNVRAVLAGLNKLNQPAAFGFPLDPNGDYTGALAGYYTGWAVLQENWKYHAVVNKTINQQLPPRPDGTPDFANRFAFSPDGLWETNWGSNPHAPNADSRYLGAGDIVFVGRDDTEPAEDGPDEFPATQVALARVVFGPVVTFERRFLEFSIPLSQRINPTGDPSDQTPTLVWDFVVRRKLETSDPRALQVAVFIRRVDPNLRPIPREPALVAGNTEIPVSEQIFSPTLGLSKRRLPVGEDSGGLPTLDGTDGDGALRYSGVHAVKAEFRPNPNDPIFRKRDRILLIDGARADLSLVRQLGQRVVDNLGNVYTVVGVDGLMLKVDPPIPPSVLETVDDPTQTSIRQLAFTPQIPVSAFVVEIEP